jgi:hypothetical protein
MAVIAESDLSTQGTEEAEVSGDKPAFLAKKDFPFSSVSSVPLR